MFKFQGVALTLILRSRLRFTVELKSGDIKLQTVVSDVKRSAYFHCQIKSVSGLKKKVSQSKQQNS